ncbi:MAG TPA: sulfatase-like hydrolase/transferase [Vicinamibacteria bacterium]|nr:sulfatase-like hydrolase/transferase [Vicinamibacteria bacterium]
MTRRGRLAVVAGLSLLGVASWLVLRSPRPPGILLVTIDTLRADRCSAYGYPRPTTPHLERLAQRGVLFEAAYAPIATTGPSHASMFTGLAPRTHGLLKNGHPLRPDLVTLAESLSSRGYQTAAFVSSYVLNHSFGFGQGFATYDDDFAEGRPSGRTVVWEGHRVPEEFDRLADQTRSRAVRWLLDHGHLSRGRRTPPFFLWVHLFDPHHPYDPPPEHRLFSPPQVDASELEVTRAAYDGEVHFADQELGKLVEALRAAGRLDDTLLIVAGDHGEGLMDHGHMYHGLQLYEEAVRVPLVVHWPQRLRPRRVREPISLVDLAPSLLALTRQAEASGIAGDASLVPPLRGAAGDPEKPVFLERRHYETGVVLGFAIKGPMLGVRKGRFKYIEAPEEGSSELFDLETDPGERRNLLPQDRRQAEELKVLLRSWVEKTPAAPPSQMLSEEAAERLRSLGYVK